MDRNSFLSIFVSFFTIGLVYQIIQEEVMKNTFTKTFFTISNYSSPDYAMMSYTPSWQGTFGLAVIIKYTNKILLLRA